MITNTEARITRLKKAAKDNGSFFDGSDDAARRDLKRAELELQALERALQLKGSVTLFSPTGGTGTTGGSGSDDGDDAARKRLITQQNQGAALLQNLDLQYASEQEKLRLNFEKQLQQIETMQLSKAELERRGFDSMDALRAEYENKAHMDYQLKQELLAERQAEEDARERERSVQKFEQVRQALLTADEAELEHWQNRQIVLAERFLYEYQLAGENNQQKLLLEQQYQTLSAKNWKKYHDTISKTNKSELSSQLKGYEQLFGSLGDLAKTFAGEQSGAYKVMFAASKAYSVAQAILSIQTGIARAAEEKFPMNLMAMAQVVSATSGIISTIKGTQMKGMAHSGIDYIPQEGTWLLDKGERVLSPRQNADLTQFMQKGGGGFSGNIIINNNGEPVTGTASMDNEGNILILLERADEHIANGIYQGTGQTSRAIEGVLGGNRARSTTR
jgi:hypothetical protein